MTMALLEIRNLKVNYGPIQAVRGIDITVDEGSIVALLGANGAGKTTTLRTISGVIKPSGGSIQLAGQEISQFRACKVARMGINMSPEGRLVFSGLTVEENLRAGAYCIRSRAETEKNMQRVLTLFPRLEERLRQQAGTLSGGEQQMLAIARALMASPKLLMLDEPGPRAAGHQGHLPHAAGDTQRGDHDPDCGAERARNAQNRGLRLCIRARQDQHAGPGRRAYPRREAD